MSSVRVRVTAGVGAWIVGATTATGLALFAVSYLNEDPQNPQGAPLSQAQVDQALASMTATTGSPAPTDASTASTGSVRTDSGTTQPTPSTEPKSSGPSAPASASTARSSATTQPVERQLSGDAGTVVAQCQGSTVYLVTWSPAQGYQAGVLQRGPAHLATIVFSGYGRHVSFHIGCPGGTPAFVEGDDSAGRDS